MNGMMHHVGSIPLPEPNTFIGGIGGSINTPALLAAKFTNVTETDIENFVVDVNNNISCYIDDTIDTVLVTKAFLNNTAITYFISTGVAFGLYVIELEVFRNATNLKIVDSYNLSFQGASSFRSASGLLYINVPNQSTLYASREHQSNTQLKIAKYRNVTSMGTAAAGFSSCINAQHILLPQCTSYRQTADLNAPFYNIASGCKIYVHPSMLTNNGGGLDVALAYAVTFGAVIVSYDDSTSPSAVSDLSSSNITTTSVDLDFTTPSSANTIQHYEVWIERTDIDEWHVDRVVGRYTPKELITSSGSTISGLVSGTPYKVYLITCDEYYNESAKSNEVTFTTL